MNESDTEQNMPNKCPQCGASLPVGALDGLCPACLLAQGAAAETVNEAAPFLPPNVDEMGRLFPQLEILSFIGKGGMGAVYKARQRTLDRIIALKILPPQAASGPGFAERFNREARALAKLNHPNIVAIHEFGQMNGLPYFIMEFVDGLNLRQLERAGKLSPREALQIVPQICEALQFAHEEGIVHRDIKPENILFDKKGRVKIADFGIAKIMGLEPDTQMSQTKAALGTPHYMAPEQVERPTTVDHRADIFSLGVVFYEMLTGELPLGNFSRPSSRKIEVDVRLDDVVLRALEKDPERRYQHASQVKTAVDTIAGTAASAPPPIAPLPTQETPLPDYNLDVTSCVRRGWALVKSDFWPMVGSFVLVAMFSIIAGIAADSFTHSSALLLILSLLLNGPILGGLCLHFLKKIRGEKTAMETAFSGFNDQFLHLFLGGFITCTLIYLGFYFLILPGVYLLIAWMFTLPLIIDRKMEFWPAMELSRKMVTKHWWQLMLFGLLVTLVASVGILALGIGLLVSAPVALAAMMYAYEDIFGSVDRSANQPTPSTPPILLGRNAVITGMTIVILALGFIALRARNFHRQEYRETKDSVAAEQPEQNQPPERIPSFAFGPVIDRSIHSLGEHKGDEALDLRTGELSTEAAASAESANSNDWLNTNRMNLLVIPGTDSGNPQWKLATKDVKLVDFRASQWAEATPANCAEALAADTTLTKIEADTPLGKAGMTIYQLPSNAELPLTLAFKTSEGDHGLIQIVEFSESPSGMKIRYKKVEQIPDEANSQNSGTFAKTREAARDTLRARLEAATMVSDLTSRDRVFSGVALDAAKTGEPEIASQAIQQISDINKKDSTAHESIRFLIKRGLRRQAISIANSIGDVTTRDRALSELAQ